MQLSWQEILYQLAFFVGSVLAVTIAYFRKPAGKEPESVSSVVAGVGVGFVSKEAEERKDALSLRKTVAMESIAASLLVLADRERHEMQETLEDGFARIDAAMKALKQVPD
jgi:hypothetical protein